MRRDRLAVYANADLDILWNLPPCSLTANNIQRLSTFMVKKQDRLVRLCIPFFFLVGKAIKTPSCARAKSDMRQSRTRGHYAPLYDQQKNCFNEFRSHDRVKQQIQRVLR